MPNLRAGQRAGRRNLADATLVAVAEYRDDKQIFSLDAHFRSYQLRGRRHLRVIPD